MLDSAITRFKTFPEFGKLTNADKEVYKEFARRFPASNAFNFGTLMTWWKIFDAPSIAQYENNLIVSFWYPGLEQRSGLSLIGRSKIDETICAIFDFQKARGDEPRVINVPEFVVSKIRYPEMFVFEDERYNDECLIGVDDVLNFDDLPPHRKRRIRDFLADYGEDRVEIIPIDLDSIYERDNLLSLIDEWRDNGMLNSLAKHEEESLRQALRGGSKLGFSALGMYIDKQIHCFVVIPETMQKGYEIIAHSRFSFEIPNIIDIALYTFAKHFKENGVRMVNIDADFGYPLLRRVRLMIGPSNFMRMYSIKPV